MPSFRGEKFAGMRPRLFDADRFRFFDADGKQLDPKEAEASTPKMTNILLVDDFDGPFAGIQQVATLNGGGKMFVISGAQSNQENDSGGAIATANGIGLDKHF